jgi:hypothetical protein
MSADRTCVMCGKSFRVPAELKRHISGSRTCGRRVVAVGGGRLEERVSAIEARMAAAVQPALLNVFMGTNHISFVPAPTHAPASFNQVHDILRQVHNNPGAQISVQDPSLLTYIVRALQDPPPANIAQMVSSPELPVGGMIPPTVPPAGALSVPLRSLPLGESVERAATSHTD